MSSDHALPGEVPLPTILSSSFDSRCLLSGLYLPLIQRLYLTFTSGSLYYYDDVPYETWDSLSHSLSKGHFFFYQIRSEYHFTRVY